MYNLTMDMKDKELLALLQANAREPTSAIARKLGVSRSTVQSRIERLEERGIIGGYTVRLKDTYAEGRIRAHVLIQVAPRHAPRVDAELKKIPELTSLYSVSGVNDLIAIIAAETTTEMDAIIDRIGAISGIERTTTSIVLATKFER